MKSFGGMSEMSFVDKAIDAAYRKNDYDKSGTMDHKEAYIALLLVYDKINKLAPFYLKPLSWKEFQVYCKKCDVGGNDLSPEEFKKLCKMVIGGDTHTWRRSLWFRVLWHALLDLFLFATMAEFIAKAAAAADLVWVSAAAVAILLKVMYKVASMLANKKLLDD